MCLTDCGVKNSQSNWENTTLFVTLIHGDRFSIQTISLLLVQINDMQLLLAWLLFESQTESWQRSQDQRQTVLYYYICLLSICPSFCLSLSPTPSAEISSTENRAEVHSLNLNPRLWNHSWRHCCHIAKDHSFLWQNLTNSARRLGNSAVQISGYTDETPRLD